MSDIRRADCETLAERLSLFALSDLPVEEQGGLTEHLAHCLDCRLRLEQLQAVANVLVQGGVDKLDGATDMILQRVASEVRGEASVSTREPASNAWELAGLGESASIGRRGRWSTGRWAASSLVAAAVGFALFGWCSGLWLSKGSGSVAPIEISAVEATEQGAGVVPTEFPTWWELQRSLGESEEIFERTLARGRSGGSGQSLEMNHLLEELR